ncbi:hypothetical protein ABIB57_004650 [Devosia sp. UYZn731]|uniref:hypothetical protein n=1 Tax=Devosia sp. UYZn731 TaxID=3156345 RepID=UPI0033930124
MTLDLVMFPLCSLVRSRSGGIHHVAKEFIDLTPQLLKIANGHDIGEAVIARADEGKTGPHGSRTRERDQYAELQARKDHLALPAGRNFH